MNKNLIQIKYKFPNDFILTIIFNLSITIFILIKLINNIDFHNYNLFYSLEINLWLLLIALIYKNYFGFDYYISFYINIDSFGFLNLKCLYIWKIIEKNIDLSNYNYTYITVYGKTTKSSYIKFNNKLNKDSLIINCNSHDKDIIQIYNYLLENFPENNNGKRWKFLVFGNNWYYVLKPYILKIFERK